MLNHVIKFSHHYRKLNLPDGSIPKHIGDIFDVELIEEEKK